MDNSDAVSPPRYCGLSLILTSRLDDLKENHKSLTRKTDASFKRKMVYRARVFVMCVHGICIGLFVVRACYCVCAG
jgi:hypothetical protein